MRNLWLLFLVGLATGFIGEKKLLVSSLSPLSAADDLYLEGRTSGDLPIDDEDGDDDGSGSGSGDYGFGVEDREELIKKILMSSRTTVSKELEPAQPQPSAKSPHIPTTAAADSPVHRATEKTTADEDNREVEKVPDVVPTAERSTEHTSTTSAARETTTTTTVSVDTSVAKEREEDNSLDRWDTTTPKDIGDEIVFQEENNEIWARDKRIKHAEEVTSENLWERTEVLAAVIACGVVGFLCAVFLLLLLAYRMKKKDEGSYDLGDTKLSTTAYHKAPTKEFYA